MQISVKIYILSNFNYFSFISPLMLSKLQWTLKKLMPLIPHLGLRVWVSFDFDGILDLTFEKKNCQS